MLTPNLESREDVSAESFRVEVEERDGQTTLVLSGSVDLVATPSVIEAARRVRQGALNVAVDWSAARYVHASSLQVLLSLRSALKANGRVLEIAADSAAVRGFLQLAGLSAQLPLKDGSAQ